MSVPFLETGSTDPLSDAAAGQLVRGGVLVGALGGNLSHYQLLGYVSSAVLALCVANGVVLTWQAVVGPRIGGRH